MLGALKLIMKVLVFLLLPESSLTVMFVMIATRSGNKKRTQNVSEYMLVLALCLVCIVFIYLWPPYVRQAIYIFILWFLLLLFFLA